MDLGTRRRWKGRRWGQAPPPQIVKGEAGGRGRLQGAR